jgi:hypothetical protein
MNCQLYLGGVTPDDYLLKVANVRYRGRPAPFNKRRSIMRAQRSPNDLSLYLEGAVALPADNASVNVLAFTIPSGMDAIITSVRNTWSGTGFENGQGFLEWSYKIGGGYIWNRGAVRFQNTASNGWTLVGSGGAFVFENQQLIVAASTITGSNAQLSGGLIESQVEGWFIPRE